MSEHYPFLELSKKLNSKGRISPPAPIGSSGCTPPPATAGKVKPGHVDFKPVNIVPASHSIAGITGDIFQVYFDASVTGVQTCFGHLSKEDIAHPPHRWFDAALARQIAIHILHNEFDIPRRQIVRELQRSRESVFRAMKVVDDRKMNGDFAESYDTMVEIASGVLKGEKK